MPVAGRRVVHAALRPVGAKALAPGGGLGGNTHGPYAGRNLRFSLGFNKTITL